MDPTRRFDGLAEIYARARPEYPEAAVDFVVEHCNLEPSSVVADVGCGTGISTRLFARRGLAVVGIEPNADMRAKAQFLLGEELADRVHFRDGTAEKTGLSDLSVDAVLCAQAFHWFEAEAALSEFHRILKAGGWVVLIWNERDESDPLMRGYGDAFRRQTDTSIERMRQAAGQPLLKCALFDRAERRDFANSQVVDEIGIIERAFSASYAPRLNPQVDNLTEALRRLFDLYQVDGVVTLRYLTSVYLARKPRSIR